MLPTDSDSKSIFTRVNLLIILIKASLYSNFGVVVSAYENSKEKAALHLSEFSIAIPKPVASGFSVSPRDSCASLQLFQGGEKAFRTAFLKH